MSDGPEPEERARHRRPGGDRVVPAWVVIPIAGGAGFVTASWPGLLFGLALGVFLWRLRC